MVYCFALHINAPLEDRVSFIEYIYVIRQTRKEPMLSPMELLSWVRLEKYENFEDLFCLSGESCKDGHKKKLAVTLSYQTKHNVQFTRTHSGKWKRFNLQIVWWFNLITLCLSIFWLKFWVFYGDNLRISESIIMTSYKDKFTSKLTCLIWF